MEKRDEFSTVDSRSNVFSRDYSMGTNKNVAREELFYSRSR